AGIVDLAFVWGEDYCETAPYSRGKVARYYVARTRVERLTLPINPTLGRPEHHEYRWVDLTEAFELTSPRLRPVIAWAAGKVMVAGRIA
ncbi:MAG TPA: NUDIX hydrolase, partial [Gammaproteobacteria bacterium]|nr:NUDIX hydrolase [Gammaproteobacteria bacterium]